MPVSAVVTNVSVALLQTSNAGLYPRGRPGQLISLIYSVLFYTNLCALYKTFNAECFHAEMHYVVTLKVEQTKGCDNLCSSFLPKESSVRVPLCRKCVGVQQRNIVNQFLFLKIDP